MKDHRLLQEALLGLVCLALIGFAAHGAPASDAGNDTANNSTIPDSAASSGAAANALADNSLGDNNAAAGLDPSANAPGQQASNVPEWSITEIALTARKKQMSTYADPGVTATFTAPNGTKATVSGFWDGGTTWRIRFAPTSLGTWNYTTSSSDAGLNRQKGSFNCVAPATGNHGFVRSDPNNPGSFVWDDGTRYFMWGQTYYDVMMNVNANGGWQSAVNGSAGYGMNKIRFHVYPQGIYVAGVEDTSYPQVIPYAGTPASPNRDQLNIPFWQNLDTYVRYLDSKGMVADLIVFDCYQQYGANQFGTSTQDNRFLLYAISRYGAFHHVIWCVANEWEKMLQYGLTQSYFDNLGSTIRSSDPWMQNGAFLRPLSIHSETHLNFPFASSSWPVHVVVQYGTANGTYLNGDQWGNASAVANDGTKPVINDEYGYIGTSFTVNSVSYPFTQQQDRATTWGIVTGGGFGSAGDARRAPSGTGNPEVSGDWYDAPDYGDISRLVSFFTTKSIPYWQMASQNSVVSSGTRVYCLAKTGQEYVFYAAAGGPFTINLPPGNYHACQFDPTTATETALSDVTGTTSITKEFSLPASNGTGSNDWVVRLRAY
jgi:hypothetical protein